MRCFWTVWVVRLIPARTLGAKRVLSGRLIMTRMTGLTLVTDGEADLNPFADEAGAGLGVPTGL